MPQLSRRTLLTATGAGLGSVALANTFGSALWAADAVRACTLTPELEVGPFYAPYELIRSDIREGKPGLPLQFTLELRHARTCAPLPNAAIDVWHCDALGIYSGFTKVSLGPPSGGGPGGPGGPADPNWRPPMDMGPNGPPPGGPGGPEGRNGPPQMKRSDDETFCRGVQLTDPAGRVTFRTIFPGWYQGRDTHIHLEVHTGGHRAGTGHAGDTGGHAAFPTYAAGHVCHTGQIAFSDELSDQVARLEPYRQHDLRRTRLKEDHVFRGDYHDYLMQLKRNSAASLAAGLTGAITVFVDPDSTPAPVGMGGPGGPPPGVPAGR